jgi:hypothetical protein
MLCVLILKIPHSIEALQEHVRLKHPPLLDYCITGWDALPDRLKQKWFTGIPRYSAGCHRAIFVGYSPRPWTSWSEFACDNLTIRQKQICDKEPLETFVSKQIKHEGTLFGLPPIPEGFCKFSENSFISRREALEYHIASRAVEEYFACVNVKAEQWLRQKIKKEGIAALRSVLEGDISPFASGEADTDEETASESDDE